MAGRAVVGGDARVRGSAPRPRRARRRGSRAASAPRRPSASPPDRQRRDPDAAADEHRPAAVARRREAAAERAEEPAARRRRRARTAGRCPGRRPRAGSRASPSCARSDAERARQERPLVLASAPALGRGEHVELARVGRGAVGVGDGRGRRRRRAARGARARVGAAPASGASARALTRARHAGRRRVQLLQRHAPAGSPWRAGGDRARGRHAAGDRGDARDAARRWRRGGSRSRPRARRCRSAC